MWVMSLGGEHQNTLGAGADPATLQNVGQQCIEPIERVADAMRQLYHEFGDRFSEVFRTITTDNGSEFAAFSEMEAYGTQVYFAHPYFSWECPVNERSN